MSRILVVDDEAIITMQLEERLTSMGYTIAGMAATGDEAIEKARRLKPDLVLMDIVMPGTTKGIEAAKVITEEMDIPVVFVTSYADDTIIEKAKQAKPYGYIVKPFNELEVKAAIEVALFRKITESGGRKERKGGSEKTGSVPGSHGTESEEPEYFDLPELKILLLKDIFTGIVVFLYTDQVAKEPIFKFALEEGLKKGGRNLYSYSHSTVQKFFIKERERRELFVHRLRKHETDALRQTLEQCMQTFGKAGEKEPIRILLDFSETDEFDQILSLKEFILARKEGGYPISGIIAVNIGKIDHGLIARLTKGIAKIIVSTGKDTTMSFAAGAFPAEAVSVVPQATVDDVVKKSLEPVILSLLEKPISGFDIVHEIHNRYKVLIPQARVYALLYDLQQDGYLEMKVSGKSKLYFPTEKGKIHIRQKLNEFKSVFQHIMGAGEGAGSDRTGRK